jgi:hypothetical protein
MDPVTPPASPPATPPVTPLATPPATPPATTPTTPEFFVKPDGSYVERFWEHPTFPAEQRDNLQLRTHKTLGDTLKNWATLEKIRGNAVVPIPGPNADPAVVDETLWKRLGWPQSPDEYTMPALAAAGLSDKDKAPEPIVKAFLAAAHGARLTDTQLHGFLSGWNKSIAEVLKGQQAQAATAKAVLLEPLKTKLGGQFDAVKALAETFGRTRLSPEGFERLQATGLFDDPAIIELFSDLYRLTKEGEPDLGADVPADVAAEAETKLNEMIADRRGPLYHADHPQHKAAQAQFNKLQKIVERARKRKES